MKKLLIDIPVFINSGAPADTIKCEYMFHQENNNGALSLLEVAQFAVYCRQCKDAFCVSACPKEALERLENGTIKRYNMRCVGCRSCVLACPFGTIFPEVMNYITSKCDLCLSRIEEYKDYSPSCVSSSPSESFSMKEMNSEDPGNGIFFAGEHLAVNNYSWRKKEGRI
jgi:Fe-S-cluster-containing dehydrogenase component